MPITETPWTALAKTLGYNDEFHLLSDLYSYQYFSIKEIARILGFSAFNVRRRLIKAGIALRSRGGPNNSGKRTLIHLTDEELFGKSVTDLAIIYKIHEGTVRAERRLRKELNDALLHNLPSGMDADGQGDETT